MADNGRWFKLWTTVLDDLDLQACELEDIGRWALLGALTKLVGTRGTVRVIPPARRLCELLRVADVDAVRAAVLRLTNMLLEDTKRANGEFTVTWKNWRKYQEDTTVAQRVDSLRSKKRREEMRREESTTPVVTREVTASDAAPEPRKLR